MANRGPQSFQKRQKEQQRREKQQEKMQKRLQKKHLKPGEQTEEEPALQSETDENPESQPQQPE